MDVIGIISGLLLVLASEAWGERLYVQEQERWAAHWEREGQNYLHASLRLRKLNTVAKNVIFFLGDGMGISTVTATRIFKGQLENKGGEDELLYFDEFPYVSLSKTYGIDRQTSDSANTATAFLCGVKANYGTLGLDGRAKFENCTSAVDPSKHVQSILKWAQDKGKWTGFVTTTRVTHATPAGLYAHSASRNWEAETPDPACKDIAAQLIEDIPGKDIRVIMGGGSGMFVPETEQDIHRKRGYRKDGKNLIQDWRNDKEARGFNARFISKLDELKSLNPDKVDYLMGLFDSDHLPYSLDRMEEELPYPNIEEMTEMAIKILSKNPEGFFLLVEGGNIDRAHHQNWGHKALVEGVDFDRAVGHAVRVTNEEDTLIVVTADHSHTFTVGGDYPIRGSNILGIGGVSDVDNRTYTTLGYYNGPGYKEDARKTNLTQGKVLESGYQQATALPLTSENHGAEDVAVFAKGPMAHLFHGVHDQSYIPYVMGYAACIGPNQQHCNGAWSLLASGQYLAVLKFLALVLLSQLFSSKCLI